MPRCLSEGVDIFLKSAERQGGANRKFATGGRCHGWQLEPCPCGLEPLYHFSIENSHLETRHQGVMFRSPWAFVVYSLTLNLQHLGSVHGQLKRCLQHFRCALTHHHTSKEYLKILIHAADLRINLQIQ